MPVLKLTVLLVALVVFFRQFRDLLVNIRQERRDRHELATGAECSWHALLAQSLQQSVSQYSVSTLGKRPSLISPCAANCYGMPVNTSFGAFRAQRITLGSNPERNVVLPGLRHHLRHNFSRAGHYTSRSSTG